MEISTTTNQNSSWSNHFKEFILQNDHPCLMAQSVFKSENFEIRDFGELGNKKHTIPLLQRLKEYIKNYDFEGSDFFTFIAVYPEVLHYSEVEFEKRLWQELQQLHDADTEPWDPEVNSDPDSHEFSFSAGGKAFYIVGMHPNSSRKARQSPVPALVFNLHHQFEELRRIGTFKTTRDMIRDRDKKLQGSINPMLKDFGENREATQYSGRQLSENWKCPFHSSKK